MDVRSGCAGFSENVALHARPASSRQLTVTDSSARATLMGPGRTPLRSSGTDTAAAGRGIRIRRARKVLRIVLGPFLLQERDRSLQLGETVQAIFHRDPAGELRARKDAKDRIVVDQALADFA